MIDYLANFNASGSFPATTAVNVSIPGAGDGTELKALMVNDAWGARQALMNYAGLTPNAASEVYTNSQFLEALKLALSPVGSVLLWYGQQSPSSLGLRFLPLEGQTVLIANYTELDSVVYVGDTNNPDSRFSFFYHASDAGGTIRSTIGDYLKIADLRGAFIRGNDTAGGVYGDPDFATRRFPGRQGFSMYEHGHYVYTVGISDYFAEVATGTISAGSDQYFKPVIGTPGVYPTGDTLHAIEDDVADSNSSETRPKNVNMKFMIRY
jgi:hypothetical protein